MRTPLPRLPADRPYLHIARRSCLMMSTAIFFFFSIDIINFKWSQSLQRKKNVFSSRYRPRFHWNFNKSRPITSTNYCTVLDTETFTKKIVQPVIVRESSTCTFAEKTASLKEEVRIESPSKKSYIINYQEIWSKLIFGKSGPHAASSKVISLAVTLGLLPELASRSVKVDL